ncbi:hypothetical protein F4804DRAFT_318662 [Jackrogersella minutella]|nr:hypothetical protein F4804DRAFT_318662 [Jackrogersella minutella]
MLVLAIFKAFFRLVSLLVPSSPRPRIRSCITSGEYPMRRCRRMMSSIAWHSLVPSISAISCVWGTPLQVTETILPCSRVVNVVLQLRYIPILIGFAFWPLLWLGGGLAGWYLHWYLVFISPDSNFTDNLDAKRKLFGRSHHVVYDKRVKKREMKREKLGYFLRPARYSQQIDQQLHREVAEEK